MRICTRPISIFAKHPEVKENIEKSQDTHRQKCWSASAGSHFCLHAYRDSISLSYKGGGEYDHSAYSFPEAHHLVQEKHSENKSEN